MKPVLVLLPLLALSACRCHSTQRFVPVGGDAPLALDTKTGQYCNPVTGKTTPLPACYDLYRNQ